MCPLTGTAPSPAACWFGVSSGQPDRRIASAMRQQLHARLDWAACVKELGDAHYPDAERIVLVLDQLNTHSSASLSARFPPAEAKRIADRLEIHYTPQHGS